MSFKFKISLKEYFDIYLLIAFLLPSLFIFFIDLPRLRKDKLEKEAKISKFIAIVYIILGPIAYLFSKII
ncbi:CLC_0170 family protein [Anaerosalibacter massiliensis]|uniref:Uncharacterized protein n=1 Tax=Anaerosalibacter massiliensis TaxID=1347392 RepID=A0A9X2MHM7_9FIRM|nr:CLC_0170 family protein [Anaerosalibacter massiliensis]MCR2044208.1 hypothetical protein [Anaerosalibacter massiliensis]